MVFFVCRMLVRGNEITQVKKHGELLKKLLHTMRARFLEFSRVMNVFLVFVKLITHRAKVISEVFTSVGKRFYH